LAERGVALSREQVYRLVAGTPQRLSLRTLAALCDILGCTAADLVETVVEAEQPSRRTQTAATGRTAAAPGAPPGLRPKRARIVPDTPEQP
jgi:DNA-binding Xre family transcriptional regulator